MAVAEPPEGVWGRSLPVPQSSGAPASLHQKRKTSTGGRCPHLRRAMHAIIEANPQLSTLELGDYFPNCFFFTRAVQIPTTTANRSIPREEISIEPKSALPH